MKSNEVILEADATLSKKKESFFRKYFLEGQALDHHAQNVENATLFGRCRKYIGFLIPLVLMETIWWTLAIRFNIFHRYKTYYQLPITMIFGAIVAGMTSEGGGAIAFPVMTLLLKLDPAQARDYSMMIQSVGMTCATFTIAWMGITVEWNSIIFCTTGATVGIVFGLENVDNWLSGPEKKMLFVSIWVSFAISLWLLNSEDDRHAHDRIQNMSVAKSVVLMATGFIGGLCTAFAGSGVDICSFSILTLLFRVSEKTATPTSIVLMAVNSITGFFWRCIITDAINPVVWMHFSTSVPIVVVVAPLGTLLASHFHRLVLATFVYVLEALALIGFLVTGPPWYLILTGAGIIIFSLIFFNTVSRIGKWWDRQYDSVALPA